MVILTAIDVNQAPERPIRVGYEMATAYDEPLVVAYVVSEDEFEEQRASTADLPAEFRGNFSVEQASERAANLAATVVTETLGEYDRTRVSTEGRVGDAATEIVALAAELEPRLVVVGGRNRSIARQALFGSVSQSVMRQVNEPVVTILENGTTETKAKV
jgi:nucleotide-binding universal stress UspA family protein